MTKLPLPGVYGAAAGFSATLLLLLLCAAGECRPSASAEEFTGAKPAVNAKATLRTPPPNATIGTASAMNKAAQESAARFSKQK